MAKLAIVLLIFVVFALIFTVKKLGSKTKKVWKEANSIANAHLENERNSKLESHSPNNDKNKAQNYTFETFMEGQSFLVSLIGEGVYLEGDMDKYLYMHFMAGAADRLSKTIPDTEESEQWFLLSTLHYGTVLCGQNEAIRILETYGVSGDESLYAAGKEGWDAMGIYISSPVDDKEFNHMRFSLYRLIRPSEALS